MEEVAKCHALMIWASGGEVGRVGDRDLDRGLELAAQLDELQEDEDGKSADGGREDGAMNYANGLGGGEGSTLAGEDDDDSKKTFSVCKRRDFRNCL